jgi:hypothetical protein
MVKGVEMERVVVTLLAFLNPPIDWVSIGVVPRNRRWGGTICFSLSGTEEEGRDD